MTVEVGSESTKQPSDEPKVRMTIDTEEEFPGIGQHMDFALYEIIDGLDGKEEKLITHATLLTTASPQDISNWLIGMANFFEKSGLKDGLTSEQRHFIQIFRLAAKQVPGLTPDDGSEFSLSSS